MISLGVDGCRLQGRRLGVGRYIEYLLREWTNACPGFDCVRVYTPGPLTDPIETGGAVSLVPLTAVGGAATWEHLVLPLRKPADDLFFCPGYVVPLFHRSRPVVVTHLGSYEALPGAFSWYRQWRARWIYKLSCRRADRVITPSESSRRDIARFYRIDPGRIEVIPLGVDPIFRPIDDSALLERRRRHYFADGRPFLLFVGKLTRRRNVGAMLEAFATVRRAHAPRHGLVLIGPDTADQRVAERSRRLGIEADVRHLPYASHRELAEAYNACDVFLYPSSYEGFGLPVLEAMACGTPTLTLDNSAIHEFASGVAHFAADASPEGLAQGITTLLESPGRRQRMRREGPARAALYGWEGIARRTLELLAETAREGRRHAKR